jgi:hypothetical protein
MAMIENNNERIRLDFVRLLGGQLKLHVAQTLSSFPPSDDYFKLQATLDALDQAVKSGDPQKAEQALFSAQSALIEFLSPSVVLYADLKKIDTYA